MCKRESSIIKLLVCESFAMIHFKKIEEIVLCCTSRSPSLIVQCEQQMASAKKGCRASFVIVSCCYESISLPARLATVPAFVPLTPWKRRATATRSTAGVGTKRLLSPVTSAGSSVTDITKMHGSSDLRGGNGANGIAILAARTALPEMGDEGITVASFNVLLPNGNDGWWIFKSYQPHVPEEHRTWEYRQELMKVYLLTMNADVVCIQEASAETFEADFGFMKDAGYDFVLHSKFRFRSATFFKASRLELAYEKHKDRVLITGFRTLSRSPNAAAAEAAASTRTLAAEDPPTKTTAIATRNRSPESEATDGMQDSTNMQFQVESPSVENEELPSKVTETSTPQPQPPKPAAAAAEVGDAVAAAAVVTLDRQDAEGRLAVVVNCHLTGGPVPERRMRQVFDALDTVRKENAKMMSKTQSAAGGDEAERAVADSQVGLKKISGGGSKGSGKAGSGTAKAVPVIVCGDMNSDGRTAVWELLRNGMVEASFREEGYPEIAITSKAKTQMFGPFGDVYEEAYDPTHAGTEGQLPGEGWEGPPSTFAVPLLDPHFFDQDGESLSPRLKVALSVVFHKFARECTNATENEPAFTNGVQGSGHSTELESSTATTAATPTSSSSSTETSVILPRAGVEAWLLTINRSLGRGSEFRAAEALLGPGPGGGLTLEDFLSIYLAELVHGKFWGVAHDLHACGVELPGGTPWVGPHETRLDHIFYSKETLEAAGVMEPLAAEQRDLVRGGDCLPNSWHPSDHLAVAGAFRFR